MAKFKPEDFLVLIVDDTSDNLYVLTEILDNAGYNVTFAKSGKEALNRIKKMPID
ncbi:MAG: response regulator, partial [Microcystaceae cyanobacterium]